MKLITPTLLLCLLLTPCLAEVTTPGADAEKMYATANSQYRGKKYEQAKPLLEKFVKQFSTNERVSVAYLQLAYCCGQLKDAKGADAALDEVIRRFYGSPVWLAAWNGKLAAAKAAGQNEAYVTAVTTMLTKLAEAPESLPDMADYIVNGSPYRLKGRQMPFEIVLGSYTTKDSWMLELSQMANTPELAAKALKALDKTLTIRKSDIPLEWQYAHVIMLRTAGQADEAQKQWDTYLKDLSDDPRAAALWALYARDAQARGDDAAADAAWNTLLEKYPTYGSLVGQMFDRLYYLNGKGRFDDYCKLAKTYLTKEVVWWHIGTVIGRAVDFGTKDPSRAPAALEIIEAVPTKGHAWRARIQLIKIIELKLASGDAAGAAKLADEIYSPQNWSADSYKLLSAWAKKDDAFKPALEAAQKKYDIPPADPKSKSAEMLATLKGKLKDDDARVAEETAEAMVNQFPQDDATIQANKAMVDYYFAKVQPELRDKWIDRMIASYKFHPLTEAVLKRQIVAEKASKKYDRLGTAIDTLIERFPPTMDDRDNTMVDIMETRFSCFEATKDLSGGAAWVHKTYGPWANAGDSQALERIMSCERRAHSDTKYIGDAWMAFAKTLGDTYLGVGCLWNAWNTYFYAQWTPYLQTELQHLDAAKPVVDALMAVKCNAETPFQFAFADINLQAARGETKAALAAIIARVKDKKIRDLSMRLDFPTLGEALGKAKMEKETDDLVKKLQGVCFTRRDKNAIWIMQAAAKANSGDNEGAADAYLKVVYDNKYPAVQHGLFNIAIGNLRAAKSSRTDQEIQKYIEKIASVQDMVPGILYEQAMAPGASPDTIMNILRTLANKYPASRAHDELAKYVDHQRNPAPPPPPPPPASKPAPGKK